MGSFEFGFAKHQAGIRGHYTADSELPTSNSQLGTPDSELRTTNHELLGAINELPVAGGARQVKDALPRVGFSRYDAGNLKRRP